MNTTGTKTLMDIFGTDEADTACIRNPHQYFWTGKPKNLGYCPWARYCSIYFGADEAEMMRGHRRKGTSESESPKEGINPIPEVVINRVPSESLQGTSHPASCAMHPPIGDDRPEES